MKQALIIRTDLKMNKGKIASQCAHASIAAFLKSKDHERQDWIREGMKKIVLKVSSESELEDLFKLSKKERLPSEMIIDAGRTQIEPGTVTALGIGPAEDKKIDEITGKLKLL
ncbi:MAG: peptidyl-tRNA hydrolase Pth2 [Candidatus Aenigmatarchaeota archaeon]